jgi:CubicO group peptidase (beta-lactamase class C family)
MEQDQLDEVGSLVTEAIGRQGLAGLAVAVVRPDAPPVLVCRGVAEVGSGRPVTADTVFRIASVTKTMTAIGLLQLEEAGRLGLDDPVNQHLKTFQVQPPPGGPPVTFRHLLTHTAGIGELPRVADVLHPAAGGLARAGDPPADLAVLYRGVLQAEVAAGTKWAYANHGFAVAGQLIQDLSGVSLPQYMGAQLFDPLGMTSSDYLRSDRVAGPAAVGHQRRRGRLRPVADYDRSLLGPGAVRSTLADMAGYAQALLQGGVGQHGRILRPDTLQLIWSPQYSPDPRVPGMGLGFFLDRLGEHRVVGHDGNLPGFAAGLLLAPDDGLGLVVLTNTATPFGMHLLARSLLRTLLGVVDEAAELPQGTVVERPQQWKQLAGFYAPDPGLLTNVRSWQLFGGELQVLVRHQQLLVRALSPMAELRRGLRLYPSDPEDPLVFAVDAGGLVVPLAFRPGPSGQAAGLAVGYPALAVLHRRPAWRSSRVRLRALTIAAAAGLAYRQASHD